MDTEGRARNGVTLESIQTQVAVMQSQMTTMQAQMTTMQDALQLQITTLQTTLQTQITGLQTQMTTMQDSLRIDQGKTAAWLSKIDDDVNRLGRKHEDLLGRFDKQEGILVVKLASLEASATDARDRLERIESHLRLGPVSRADHVRAKATRTVANGLVVKRGKKA